VPERPYDRRVEPLPVVDEHVRAVAAPPQRTWDAVVAVMGGTPTVPGPLATAWGLEHRERRGDWARPTPGDAVPGSAVAEADPPRTLTLNGGHRFSRYEITFTLEPTDAGHTRLHARTAAAFPGPLRQISRPRPRWPRPPGAGCAAAPRRSPGCSW
jgi:hypothetical protein